MTQTSPVLSSTPGPALAASLRRALTQAAALDPEDLRERLVLEALVPTGQVSAGPVPELLSRRGLVVLGSRGAGAGHECPALYLAATAETWESLCDWFGSHPTPRRLAGFTLARASVRTDVEVLDGSWTATLHPDMVASTPTQRMPASAQEVAAFTAAVERVGGSVVREHLRAATLTYVPVRLPDVGAAVRLGSYNALRSLRPTARIGVR